MREEGGWLGRGERVENGGEGVFSLGPPFKRKRFLSNLTVKQERKVRRECVWCEITHLPSLLFINVAFYFYFLGNVIADTTTFFFFCLFPCIVTSWLALFLSFFLFSISNSIFFYYYFFWLDVLLVVLVCSN